MGFIDEADGGVLVADSGLATEDTAVDEAIMVVEREAGLLVTPK